MHSVNHPYQKIAIINYNAFPSVLVLYYNLVSSEFADMEDIDNEVGKEDKEDDSSYWRKGQCGATNFNIAKEPWLGGISGFLQFLLLYCH